MGECVDAIGKGGVSDNDSTRQTGLPEMDGCF
jgi:hypothetical protein